MSSKTKKVRKRKSKFMELLHIQNLCRTYCEYGPCLSTCIHFKTDKCPVSRIYHENEKILGLD